MLCTGEDLSCETMMFEEQQKQGQQQGLAGPGNPGSEPRVAPWGMARWGVARWVVARTLLMSGWLKGPRPVIIS